MSLIFLTLFWLTAATEEPQILLTTLKDYIDQFIWCNNSILILHTEHNKVYRGSSKGTIYKQILLNDTINIVKGEGNLLYFIGSDFWISNDCGDSVKRVKIGFNEIKMNPLNSEWMLGQSERYLYLSQDSGLNWQKIAEDIIKAEWGFNEERINKVYALTNSKQLIETVDFFKSIKVLYEDINNFTLTDTYLFLENTKELIVSNVYEHFNKMYPFTFETKRYFRVLDATKSRAFVFVSENKDSMFGDIYISDSYASHFEIAIKNCIHNSIYGADFIKIEGLEGVYIINVLSERAVNEYNKLEEETLDEVRKNKIVTQLIQNNIKSFITFNYGKNWKHITPPKDNIEHCFGNDMCSLHLFINRYTAGHMSTRKNAPGFIVANGNIGRYLNTNSLERKVYLSKDGGFSWEVIASKEHIHNITDSGNIIALSKPRSSTVKYSLDRGKSWLKEVMIHNDPSILSILTEPSANSQYILIHAEFFNKSEDEVTMDSIYSINFENLYDRKCREDKDYEIWKPHNIDQCIMGRKTSYIRKKPGSECYSELKVTSHTENCECTANDYECEYGFIRINDTCLPSINDLCSSGEASISAYRKIADNSCEGGVKYKVIECKYLMNTNVLIIIMVAVSGVVMIKIYCYFLRLVEEGEFEKVEYEKASADEEIVTLKEIAMKEIDALSY